MAMASSDTTAASRSGPAKARIDSSERQDVSTMISTSSPACRTKRVAPRKPATLRKSGSTLMEKWARYLGHCSWLVRAVHWRRIIPGAEDEAVEEEAGGSLPTTTFHGRTSHFFARRLSTYGSLRAKASTLLLSAR